MWDQDKKWVPQICCLTCVKHLTGWAEGFRHMNLAIPMVWREPQDHSLDCYFCIMQIRGVNSKYQTHSKIPKFAICYEAGTSQWGLTNNTSSYTSNSRKWIGTWGSYQSSKWGVRWSYFLNKYIFLWTSSVKSRRIKRPCSGLKHRPNFWVLDWTDGTSFRETQKCASFITTKKSYKISTPKKTI
jgi:hypothetical protein